MKFTTTPLMQSRQVQLRILGRYRIAIGEMQLRIEPFLARMQGDMTHIKFDADIELMLCQLHDAICDIPQQISALLDETSGQIS